MNKSIITLGIGYGILGFLSSYLMISNAIGMWSSLGLGFLIFIAFCVATVWAYRKATGQSGFKQIFGAMLIMGLVGSLIAIFLTQAYVSTLSTDQLTSLEENFIDSQVSYYESLGMPDEQINEMEDVLSEKFTDLFSMKSQLLGLPISFLFLVIIALIIGLIMKKEESPL
jgi:ribose/xylose/arabinose/galactoside ABC-type transport system permease subunit